MSFEAKHKSVKMNSGVTATILIFFIIIHFTDARCPTDGKVTEEFVRNSSQLWTTRINLSSCSPKLDLIEDGAFSEIKNSIRSLILHYNKLTRISHLTFRGHHSVGIAYVEHLYLNDNKIARIQDSSFNWLPNLKTLYLYNNNLESLDEKPFSGLVNLTYLNLHSNGISAISTNTFRGLTNLKYLFLNHNKIGHIEDDAFADLTNLITLNLSQNNISSLATRIFDSLAQLKLLFLSDNQIINIPRNLLLKLVSLQILQIDANRIEHIDNDAFSNLHELTTINAKNNYLKAFLSINLDSLTKLKSLSLSNNNIEITSNSYFPSSLQNLTELQLGNNKLTTISFLTFSNLTRIQRLDLSGNLISTIDEKYSFTIHTNLTYLNLSHNSIEYLPPRLFSKCSSAQSITVYVCPHSFNKIQTIDLSYNKIKTTSPGYFLYTIIGTTFNAGYIQLNLEHNNINSLHNFVFYRRSLPMSSFQPLRINLKNNTLTTIPDFLQNKYFYQHNPSYTAVNFLNNPLHCNCEMQKLYNLIAADSTLLHEVQHIVCETPFSGLLGSHSEPLQCLPPTDVTITYDYNMTTNSYSITCTAKGDPAPYITWITSNKTFSFPPSTDRRVLSNTGIIWTSTDPAQNFTCIAKNTANSSMVTMTLGEILAQTTMEYFNTSTVAVVTTAASLVTSDNSTIIGLSTALGILLLIAVVLAIALIIVWRKYKLKLSVATANKTHTVNVRHTNKIVKYENTQFQNGDNEQTLDVGKTVIYENTQFKNDENKHNGHRNYAGVNVPSGKDLGGQQEKTIYENETITALGYETMPNLEGTTEMAYYESLKQKPRIFEHDYLELDDD